MATSEDSRKKSRSAEKRESRKKKREESQGYSKSRHSKSKKSSQKGTSVSKKVRSISELVKLVISGEVKVPKGLRHYAEDRAQLLDQVFTILSESDVRGVLPDILKGLKMGQLRQLCLEQLKAMSTEDIIETIDPETSTDTGLNVDAAVFKLLGTETEESGGTGDGEIEVTSRKVQTTAGSSSDSGRGGEEGLTGAERGGKDGECGQLDRAATRKKSDLLSGGDDRQQSGLPISDVSSDNNEGSDGEDATGELVNTNSPPQTMECDTTTSEISFETRERREKGGGRSEREHEAARGEDSESVSSSDSSLGDLDDCWLCDFPEEMSEWARLQEIEFRRRALEAELRRRGEGEGEGEGEGMEAGRGDGGVPLQTVTDKVDKSEAIELQMRQRALQSLLARKKEQEL